MHPKEQARLAAMQSTLDPNGFSRDVLLSVERNAVLLAIALCTHGTCGGSDSARPRSLARWYNTWGNQDFQTRGWPAAGKELSPQENLHQVPWLRTTGSGQPLEPDSTPPQPVGQAESFIQLCAKPHLATAMGIANASDHLDGTPVGHWWPGSFRYRIITSVHTVMKPVALARVPQPSCRRHGSQIVKQ